MPTCDSLINTIRGYSHLSQIACELLTTYRPCGLIEVGEFFSEAQLNYSAAAASGAGASSTPCFDSIIASAIFAVNSFTALIASSFAGIT